MKKDSHKQHLTELRATLPASLEHVSETVWKDFQALHAEGERQWQSTLSNSNMTALAKNPPEAVVVPTNKEVTIDQALQLARRGNRVCPMPEQWKAMFALMQRHAPANTAPPNTIDGAAWNAVPRMQRRLRLRDQLEWAERHNVLEFPFRFLKGLSEDDWLHF